MISTSRNATQRGFTLVEVAVVLLVVGLLIAGLLRPVSTQLENRRRAETRDALVVAREALYGFAVIERRLPFADADGDGLEDGGASPAYSGRLPYRTLGLPPTDGWGRYFSYAVDAGMTVPKDPAGTCANDGDLDLCERPEQKLFTRGDNPATATIEGKFVRLLTAEVAALVVSHGANGFGAVDAASGLAVGPVPAAQADEAENADGDESFVSRGFSNGGAGCADSADESVPLCAYDDLLIWLPGPVLIDRLVRAGRLP